jgi:hypothetical protein
VCPLDSLVFVLVRVAELRLDSKRLPEREKKQLLLDGIARATRALPRSVTLRIVGLKPSRYHTWCHYHQAARRHEAIPSRGYRQLLTQTPRLGTGDETGPLDDVSGT